MGKHVSQFASLMDGTGSFRRAVTADAARKRELLEKLAEPSFVLTLFRIDLGVSPFEITGPENARRSMPRPGHEDHVQVQLFDQPVQMNVHERQTRARSPMSEQPVLDVLRLQRLLQ